MVINFFGWIYYAASMLSVYVNSDGVSAAIIEGNITVSNGVVHIVDQLLGFVYNNIREQIQQESTYVIWDMHSLTS